MNFEINNDIATLRIDNEIGESWFSEGVTIQDFAKTLNEVSDKQLDIIVTSPGGDVAHGLAIYDLIRSRSGVTNVRFEGMAASAATVLAMSATKVSMSDAALILIHRASAGEYGNVDDMQDVIDILNAVDSRLANIYSQKTGRTPDECLALMKEDKWLTAQEAFEFGLIDEIYKGKLITNAVKFKEMEKKLKNVAPEEEKKPMHEEEPLEAVDPVDPDQEGDLATENEQLKATIEQLKAELEKLKEGTEEAEAEAVVEDAIKEGKIKASDKSKFIAHAKAIGLTNFKALIADMPKQQRSIKDDINKPIDTKALADKWQEKVAKGKLSAWYSENKEEYEAALKAYKELRK